MTRMIGHIGKGNCQRRALYDTAKSLERAQSRTEYQSAGDPVDDPSEKTGGVVLYKKALKHTLQG